MPLDTDNEGARQLSKLKKRRAGYRSRVTVLENEIENSLENHLHDDIEKYATELKRTKGFINS